MVRDIQAGVALLGITLPIVLTILIAAWLNNKRIDTVDTSLNRRVDDLRGEMVPLLREILATVKDLDRRLTVLEERSS
ncbi:MAG: hypothetical protein HY238_23335, partial [Acidobacteria bacterium]|nr:hypothetical protein [Acidobacteriota bacterium]